MTREAALSVVLAHVVRNKEDFPTRAEHEALRRDCEECCPALIAKPGDLFILRALNLIQGTQHTHTNFTVEYQGRMTEENEVTAGRLIFSNFSSDIFYIWEGDRSWRSEVIGAWPMEAVDAADARQRLEHGDFDKKFFILPPHECFRLRKYEGQIFNPIVRRGPVIRGTVPMGNVRALEAFLGFGNQ